MKKYLLSTMMLVGALAYGQGNKVIVPLTEVGGTGTATATLGIEVEGKVFEKTNKSLVVEIKSTATPDGRGFSFQMPDMFIGSTGDAVTGRFVASIQKDLVKEPFAKAPIVNLLAKDGTLTTNIPSNEVMGTASDVKLKYTLTGKSAAGDLEHDGTINVQANSEGKKTGSYTDNTIKLVVKVENQTI